MFIVEVDELQNRWCGIVDLCLVPTVPRQTSPRLVFQFDYFLLILENGFDIFIRNEENPYDSKLPLKLRERT